MDTVLEQINEQEKQKKEKLNKVKVIYNIYHFITKVILYSILMILIIAAIFFVLYFVDMQYNIKKGTYKQPLFGAYIIISPSMVPTINVYDAIVIKRTEAKELKEDDIITFLSSDSRYSGLTITHRITGIEKSQNGEYLFRTKGDNNNSEDSALVKESDIYGKVILKIPKIGYLQQILTNSFGWILLIVIPCMGVVIYDIIKIFKSLARIGTWKIKKKNEFANYRDNYIETISQQEKTNDSEVSSNDLSAIENNIDNDNDDDIDYL